MVVMLPRKRRTWTRSKRGCKTCRERHVKCDETFPACRRCSSTGRICDGSTAAMNEWEIVTVSSISSGLDRRPSLPGVRYDSKAEASFTFFQHRTADYVAGLLDQDFKALILRTAEQNEAIYHAVLAVGSIHKTLVAKQSLSTDLDEDDYAIKQYASSMRLLAMGRGSESAFSVHTFLAACILFTSFEILRRNYGVATQHVQSGLRIMLQLEDNSNHGTEKTPIAVQSFVPAFARLERQFQELTGGPTPLIQILAAKQAEAGFFEYSTTSPQPIPWFETLDDAWLSLHQIWHALITWVGFAQRDWFNHLGDVHLGSLSFQIPTDERQDRLRQDIDLWSLGLQNLVKRLPDMSKRQQSIHALLQCHTLLANSVLGTATSAREMLWDEYVPHFRQLVDLCRIVVENEVSEAETAGVGSSSRPFLIQQRYTPDSAPNKSNANCPLTFDLSVSMVLFHVVTKCRDAKVRYDAIRLLEDYPRLEGLWDGIAIAKAGRSIDLAERGGASLEEAAARHASADEIPLPKRVLDLRARVRTHSRSAELVLYQEERIDMVGAVVQTSVFSW